ncbi:hypothetical protein SAPIO_CDS6700 [Scedosporium apiospermum]|uniref:Transcription factor domain-containing protein n=1 Tax=Pseudallescheria apiosperma TaxID=563466 RepID=A0A084G325_PSEDA|nr:uncharacterized protein SAPIO_CDS6700 [Scedosporium apiospermum]KEZ41737.1 hypothetical protein SAPIO_CDS6700 [Scedosporium apiospermum]
MSRSNNDTISQNLFRIYHDVLEQSLSCWIAEETCPYTDKRSMRVTQGRSPRWMAEEQGTTWSNRIYSRVIRFDRYARSVGLIRLTARENQAATKSLHLAIMAFTSQWAQGSRREREQYAPASEGLNADDLVQEFDRNIQISLWEQAKEALKNTSGIECFRVACAELIFGLCQKPWDFEDIEPMDRFETRPRDVRGANNDTTSLAARLDAVIAKDGTPTHMENAARKAHAIKFRWDAQRRGLTTGGQVSEESRQTADSLSTDEQQHEKTVGLVYWLAVMFDTVSSSTHERPVVVADEDSQHCNASASTDTSTDNTSPRSSESGLSIRRWSTPLFIQDDPERPMYMPHWPCSYEAAAEAVTRSCSVKVLLHRHVSWLQNAIRRGDCPESIEGIIQGTVLLYRYWNTTYGPFFKDLVRDFPSVPPRIQSWSFCLSSHWHLAAFIFADLLDFVDKNQLGSTEASQTRIQISVAERIRKASANEISDLAKVSVPSEATDSTHCNTTTPQSQSQPQSMPPPDFHFAVNKCTILTEPWTMLIIRGFTKAGAIHIARAQDLWQARVTDPGYETHRLNSQALIFSGRTPIAVAPYDLLSATTMSTIGNEVVGAACEANLRALQQTFNATCRTGTPSTSNSVEFQSQFARFLKSFSIPRCPSPPTLTLATGVRSMGLIAALATRQVVILISPGLDTPP